jgi:cephalosporin hydroxylase
MTQSTSKFTELEKGWKTLKRLHPVRINLERIALIREKELEFLSQPTNLESLMLELGFNDEGMKEIPESLHAYCGQGLRIWQYPIQFSQYLVELSQLKISSYLEIGIRHGGTFVMTVEYLEKFYPLDFAIGIDIIPCPSMVDYQSLNPKIEFINLNTQSHQFQEFLDKYEQFDLVFIDSHHEESQCMNEFNSVKNKANIIVFHDIANIGCPGIQKVWHEVKSRQEYDCREYVDQYKGMGPYMGIGMAVRKNRQEKVVTK